MKETLYTKPNFRAHHCGGHDTDLMINFPVTQIQKLSTKHFSI